MIKKINIATVPLILAIFIAYLSIINFKFGIDFSDESFYLASIASPELYKSTISQFGHIFNPIFLAVNKNVFIFRTINFIAIYFISIILSYTILIFIYGRKGNRYFQIYLGVIAISFSSTGLACLFLLKWIPTPSYNYLNFIGALTFAIGAVFLVKNKNSSSSSSQVICGIGASICLLAKPTTFGLLLALFFFLSIALKGDKLKRLYIFVISVSVIFFIAALLIDGSIEQFLYRYSEGLKLASKYNPTDTSPFNFLRIFRIDKPPFDYGAIFIFIVISIISNFLLKFNLYKSPNKLGISLILLFGSVIFGILLLRKMNFDIGYFSGFNFLAPILMMLFLSVRNGIKTEINKDQILLFITFALMPYAYALGSGLNYWQQEASAVIFWVLSILIFISAVVPRANSIRYIYFCGLLMQSIFIFILFAVIESPYAYDQSLRFNKCRANFGYSELKFSNNYCEFVNKINSTMDDIGFNSNTPVIDLTGKSPGILYAMRAQQVGFAWIMGGSPGSFNWTRAVIDGINCETLGRSWLLLEPGGPLQISPDNPDALLNFFGAKLSVDYELTSHWLTPKGIVGDGANRLQRLYRPIHSEIIKDRCLIMRDQNEK